MSTYRIEWPCCGDVTETQAWEPQECPFCNPRTLPILPAAAPELLEAMRASIELADRNMAKLHANGVMAKRTPEAQAVYAQCVAAIAKAIGGTA